jgi:predicted DNA-binding protein (UPF0251 family)
MCARERKPRACDCVHKGGIYKPSGIPSSALEKIDLALDELESLRLCDHLGMTQQEAGFKMGISRGTVQRILASARAKVADALSNCKALVLEDTVCNNKEEQ